MISQISVVAQSAAPSANPPGDFTGIWLLVPLIVLIFVAKADTGTTRKPLGGVLSAAGIFLVIFVMMRLNSVASELRSGPDTISAQLLSFGIPATFVGIWMLLSSKKVG